MADNVGYEIIRNAVHPSFAREAADEIMATGQEIPSHSYKIKAYEVSTKCFKVMDEFIKVRK
jgi:hypothetical protein